MTIPFYNDLSEFSIVPNVQGEWDFRKVYIAGSLVSYNGKLYEAQTPVDQSQDAVQLRHDDFHRPDIADGWGTASDGNIWTGAFNAPGYFYIQNNVGFSGTGSGAGDLTFGDELPTANIEVLLKFSGTGFSGDGLLDVDYRFDYQIFASGVSSYILLSSGVPRVDQVKLLGFDNTDAEFANYNSANAYPFPLIDGSDYLHRLQASGNSHRSKIWNATDNEPDSYTVSDSRDLIFTNNTFAIFALGEVIFQLKEITVWQIPDAPDVNTTDWLLIG